ncbi:MAG: type II toxin-antitoxin system prevent-host-death family antitoxin [Nitrospira sp.]|nr:type II toxin-antitoxin system prevent-host-death family antitoxin [Nitrospira sp.]
MIQVGVRDLKNRLSQYLKRAKSGQTIQVTEIGHVIALVTGVAPRPPQVAAHLHALVNTGALRWSGGKPLGISPARRLKGKKTLSALLLEDRR